MVDLTARATATVCLRRSGKFEGKIKPGAEAVDGMAVHLRGAGTCDGSGIYDADEDRWDVDFRHHDSSQWPEDWPIWFAAGDLTNLKRKSDT